MKQIRLCLEYDGTDYVGWQAQANGPSIQVAVEAALTELLGHPLRLTSSGRTDAGVHARGMVASFTTSRDLPLRAYREGLNRLLPADIAVREAAAAAGEFHPRFDATGKWYRYQVYSAAVRSPLLRRYAWHVRRELDLEAMARAAADFVGHHDFAAFRSAHCDARSTDRRIQAVEVHREGELIFFDVRGCGFLRHMVRIMCGTLVEVGSGRRPATDIRGLLAGGERSAVGPTAPARGLFLMQVYYP